MNVADEIDEPDVVEPEVDQTSNARQPTMTSSSSSVVELNVGGTYYTTTSDTLMKRPNSVLARLVAASVQPVANGGTTGNRATKTTTADGVRSSLVPLRDRRGRLFIDRDGLLFRYVLDYMRTGSLAVLPVGFAERRRLLAEAQHFRLDDMVDALQRLDDDDRQQQQQRPHGILNGRTSSTGGGETGYVTVGYRGTFGCGRAMVADGPGSSSDIRFRKVSRILVSGRTSLCREVFGDKLNDSRSPDARTAVDDAAVRYSARFYLKHAFIEQAFDALLAAGFELVAACGTGTNGARGVGDAKPGVDVEESKWNHYNEFVFCRS